LKNLENKQDILVDYRAFEVIAEGLWSPEDYIAARRLLPRKYWEIFRLQIIKRFGFGREQKFWDKLTGRQNRDRSVTWLTEVAEKINSAPVLDS